MRVGCLQTLLQSLLLRSRGLLNEFDFMRQVEIAQSISTSLALGNFSTVHFCNRKVEALLVSRAKLGAIHHEEFKSIPL